MPTARRPGNAMSALTWGLLFFAVGQLLLAQGQRRLPHLRDPDFGRKLADLQALRRARPGRPLAVLLGSSRVNMGLRPELLAAVRAPDGGDVVVYNFGLNAAGPLRQLLTLHRLLAAGIRPDWICIEFWPRNCGVEGRFEPHSFDVVRLNRRELDLWGRYTGDPKDLRRRWWDAQLTPAYSSRFVLLSLYAPLWVPDRLRSATGGWRFDRYGWTHFETRLRGEELRNHCNALLGSGPFFWPDQPRLAPTSLQAFADLFALCRRAGIHVALLVLPEGPDLRAGYPAEVKTAVDAYLEDIRGTAGVPAFDLRAWMPADALPDGIHLSPAGAAAFSQRFGREVLQPFVRDQAAGLPRDESPLLQSGR